MTLIKRRQDKYPVAPNLPKGATISTIEFKALIQHANRKSAATKE